MRSWTFSVKPGLRRTGHNVPGFPRDKAFREGSVNENREKAAETGAGAIVCWYYGLPLALISDSLFS